LFEKFDLRENIEKRNEQIKMIITISTNLL